MRIKPDSIIFEGCFTTSPMNGAGTMPWVYTSSKEEFLACRETAWLGINLNLSPVFDIRGNDAARFLDRYCVNRGFGDMVEGQSKHAVMCNEKGHMLADGVVMKKADGYRTYWMAPTLQFFMMESGMDVQGEYHDDEYFYQIDGPKSLEILEEACECDLHDIRFARNKTVKICGTDITVHRLGMSGALAYEVHGRAEDSEIAYKRILEVLRKYGGKQQGAYNYAVVNHTPAGYPNQNIHFNYALHTSGKTLDEFALKYCMNFPLIGSASVEPEFCEVTPYDVGWGYLVNFNHDFVGKEALMKAKEEKRRVPVTLEWNTEDVADVFASQFRGQDVEPYDKLDCVTGQNDLETVGVRCDYVLAGDQIIGYASGRTYAYYERRMISLAFINPAFAQEGTELAINWSHPGGPVKMIRAIVARFPYYNGEYRNETFDTEKIPHRY